MNRGTVVDMTTAGTSSTGRHRVRWCSSSVLRVVGGGTGEVGAALGGGFGDGGRESVEVKCSACHEQS